MKNDKTRQDLNYEKNCMAATDMNLVITGDKAPFNLQYDSMLDSAKIGLENPYAVQLKTLDGKAV